MKITKWLDTPNYLLPLVLIWLVFIDLLGLSISFFFLGIVLLHFTGLFIGSRSFIQIEQNTLRIKDREQKYDLTLNLAMCQDVSFVYVDKILTGGYYLSLKTEGLEYCVKFEGYSRKRVERLVNKIKKEINY